ncbi:MAG TPA: histidine kinase [Pyrinomonadaceae bacterium]|nr:histidine kinase [Pyrinomonadaceae bacterium]
MPGVQATSGPRKLFVKLSLGFCLCTAVGLFFSVRGSEGISAGSLLAALPRWYVWGALTPFIIWTDRRLAASAHSLTRRLLLHLPASLVWTCVFVLALFVISIALSGRPLNPAGFADKVRADFWGTFQWNVQVYWMILGGWLAWSYYHESRNRELKASQLEKLLAEARLQTLRTQLQPHFLFNALNTISAFVERNPKGARRMIEHLGDLLRFSLDGSARQETTLQEELAALDHYLAIQRVRFEDHLKVSVSAEPGTLRAAVPGLILQPLVENAIRHGATKPSSSITVSAWRDNGQLHLRVMDDGPGLPPSWQLPESAGIGLSNTQQRLAQLYPAAHTFAVREGSDGGVVAEIVIPYREEVSKRNVHEHGED